MEDIIKVLRTSDLFRGISDKEISAVLPCLNGIRKSYKKEEFIVRSGEQLHKIGMVIKGEAMIIKEDYWGRRAIISGLTAGDVFGEAYACMSFTPMEVSIEASTDIDVIFFDIGAFITTCGSNCAYHTRLIQNLLNTLANKNLSLTQKIDCLSKRTIRDRLLTYLSSQALKAGSSKFTIPFSRQQLADYLSVDRSALSNEISKLVSEGYIENNKNTFRITETDI